MGLSHTHRHTYIQASTICWSAVRSVTSLDSTAKSNIRTQGKGRYAHKHFSTAAPCYTGAYRILGRWFLCCSSCVFLLNTMYVMHYNLQKEAVKLLFQGIGSVTASIPLRRPELHDHLNLICFFLECEIAENTCHWNEDIILSCVYFTTRLVGYSPFIQSDEPCHFHTYHCSQHSETCLSLVAFCFFNCALRLLLHSYLNIPGGKKQRKFRIMDIRGRSKGLCWFMVDDQVCVFVCEWEGDCVAPCTYLWAVCVQVCMQCKVD